jgi:hypothetical protein
MMIGAVRAPLHARARRRGPKALNPLAE